jgi:hypothetical protein
VAAGVATAKDAKVGDAKAGETKDAKDTKGTTGLSGFRKGFGSALGEYMEKTENSAKSTQDALFQGVHRRRGGTAELREDGQVQLQEIWPSRSSPISR